MHFTHIDQRIKSCSGVLRIIIIGEYGTFLAKDKTSYGVVLNLLLICILLSCAIKLKGYRQIFRENFPICLLLL